MSSWAERASPDLRLGREHELIAGGLRAAARRVCMPQVTHGRYFLPAAELVARLAGAAQCRTPALLSGHNDLLPDLRPPPRRWDVVITAPSCPCDSVISQGAAAALGKPWT